MFVAGISKWSLIRKLATTATSTTPTPSCRNWCVHATSRFLLFKRLLQVLKIYLYINSKRLKSESNAVFKSHHDLNKTNDLKPDYFTSVVMVWQALNFVFKTFFSSGALELGFSTLNQLKGYGLGNFNTLE